MEYLLKTSSDVHIKSLLRRIEHEVEREEAYDQLVKLMQESSTTSKEIIDMINNEVISKIEVFNRIGSIFYENGLFEDTLPFFEQSIAIEPHNEDTLFNIGYVLSQFQCYEAALGFLKQITSQDSDTQILMRQIEEHMAHE
jgi:tetratricopeptide (TPR) repeat protein